MCTLVGRRGEAKREGATADGQEEGQRWSETGRGRWGEVEAGRVSLGNAENSVLVVAMGSPQAHRHSAAHRLFESGDMATGKELRRDQHKGRGRWERVRTPRVRVSRAELPRDKTGEAEGRLPTCCLLCGLISPCSGPGKLKLQDSRRHSC